MVYLRNRTGIELLRDYERVNRILEECLSTGDSHNFSISNSNPQDYMNPQFSSTPVPLNDSNGKFVYFAKVRDAIEGLLIGNNISPLISLVIDSPKCLRTGSEDYIVDLPPSPSFEDSVSRSLTPDQL